MPQAIVIAFSIILFALILKPIALINAYFFLLPMVLPFANEQLKLFYLPINWPFAAVIVLSVFPLGFLRGRFRIVQKNMLNLYLLTFLSVISCAYSINVSASIGQSVKFLNALCLVLLAVNAVSSRDQIVRIYQGVVFSSIIPMIYGYYQYVTKTGVKGLGGEMNRLTSFFGFANSYGIFLALVIFCGLIVYFHTQNKRMKILYGLILVSAVASSILALNRGSWIAVGLASLLALPFYRKYVSIKWFIIAFTVLGLIAAGVMIARFLQLQEDYSNTFESRKGMWLLIYHYADRIPFLGFGAGTSQIAMDELFGVTNVPHNDYLRLLIEMGILGPVLYIVFLVKEFLCNLRVRTRGDAWHVNYFTLVMIIYWIIISFAQNIYHQLVIFPLFLVCCFLAKRYVELK